MIALLAIFITLPVTVSVLASLFSQRIIPTGSEWSVVITTVSLYFAAFGAIQTYEGRRITQQMQDMDKARELKRTDALIRHEIPHVVYSLKMLRLEMGKTMMMIIRHSVNGVVQTSEDVEQLRRRAIMHSDSIRVLSPTFFHIDLSEHHGLLDTVLVNLDEVAFLSQNDEVDMAKFKESMYMVSHVIRLISNKYGIDREEV